MTGLHLAVVLVEEVTLGVRGRPVRVELDAPGLLVEAKLVEPHVRHDVDAIGADGERVLNLLEGFVMHDVEQLLGVSSQGGHVLHERPVLFGLLDACDEFLGAVWQLVAVVVVELVAECEVGDRGRVDWRAYAFGLVYEDRSPRRRTWR